MDAVLMTDLFDILVGAIQTFWSLFVWWWHGAESFKFPLTDDVFSS